MTLLMFDEHPLIVDKKLAKLIGLNQAMVLQQVHYWLELNKKSNRNFHEERYWTYNTIEDWQEEFPFWSKETVKRIFKKLRDLGFLIVGNFNHFKMDRTLWYSIDYDKLKEYIGSNCSDPSGENDQMEKDNLTPPLPETNTKINTEIYNPSVNQEKEEDKIKKEDQGQKERKTNLFKDEYEKIINRCELFAIDESYRDPVAHAIKLLLLDIDNKKRIRIGDNNYPVEMVKVDLEKLDFHIVQHGINKFKEASGNYEIKNTIAYLKACIYNAIHEVDIDTDSKLRSFGLI